MQNQQSPKETKYRFVIFAVYLAASLVNSLPCNTFSGMNSTVEQLFSISAVEVTLNSLLFPIAHVFFAYPCNWIINRYGIRVSYFVGGGFVVGGAWLRTFLSEGDPYICLLGSMTAAIGNIFILNTGSKLAFSWFRSEVVPLITFIFVFANLLSLSISLVLSGFIINSNSTQDDVLNYLRIQAAVVTVPFILLLIFIKQKPDIAPSKAAAAADSQKRQKYTILMKKLFTNKEYLKLSVAMAFNYGISIALFGTLDQTLKGLGYEEPGQVISVMGVAGTIFGILGNYVYSTILKKTQAYKYTAAAINFGTFSGYVLLIMGFINHADKAMTICLLSIIFGFHYLSSPPTFILFAAETAFPIDQASVTGYLFAISQTFGFLGGIICSAVLDKTQLRSQIVLISLGLFLFLSFFVVLTIKQDLKKTKFQKSLLNQSIATKIQSLVTDQNLR